MSANAPNPSHIMQVGMGFLASKTLLSAVELGVFATLGKGPMRGEDLRQRLGLHPRSAADFLDALVALGFLTREGDGAAASYANAPDAAAFLDPASPTYLGGILLMANRRLYPFWAGLTEALRTGEPQNESKGGDGDLFANLYADPKALEEFMDAMAGVQLGNFAALAEKFDFSRYKTCCDVGGASGALSIAARAPASEPALHFLRFAAGAPGRRAQDCRLRPRPCRVPRRQFHDRRIAQSRCRDHGQYSS